MRRTMVALLVFAGFCLMTASALLMQPGEANAIPAFARKYRMSCTTCHAPVPRLKDYGDDFAGNGFVLEDKDAPRYFVDAGDERLDLIREFPVAARFEGFVKHQTETGKETDLSLPYNLKLLSGGALTDDVAYYFYFYLSEHGEIAGIEDAYLMFNNLLGSELDVYLGQFQVSDPLFKRELRLTYEDYQIYKSGVGLSHTNLAYDRGLMLTYGFETGTDIVFELINGNGIEEADAFRTFDDDKYKNIAGRISQDVNEYARIGAFAYYGKQRSITETTSLVLNPDSIVIEVVAEPMVGVNELWMAGPDLTLSFKDKLELNLQYLERRDDNPWFNAAKPDDKIETRGGLAELILMPGGDRSRYYGVLLYNRVDSDLHDDDYETVTGHVGYVLRTNIRLIAETTYDIENEENRAVVGFVVAF